MQTKILRIKTSSSRYGGNIYEHYVTRALQENYSVVEANPVPENAKAQPFRALGLYLRNLRDLSRHPADVHIRALETAQWCSDAQAKRVVIAHHYDTAYSALPSKLMQRWGYANLLRHRDDIDVLVVVSRYWERFFARKGFKRIEVIYNPFETKRFEVSEEDVEAFKRRYALTDKPIVYIGNAQRKKGVVETYEALKEMDVHLVTSGKAQVKLPVLNLDTDFDTYVLLLHAASATVTMSLFDEGWNRTAHEAMLCKTPVVGSGRGGMRELLEGGGQPVCESFDDLRRIVEKVLDDKTLGQKGYTFAKKFTFERFAASWQSLISEIV